MAIGTSNTFVLTAASTALSAARGQINGSLQAVAQSFYSDARPVAANFQNDGGDTVAFTDASTHGILHYNSSTKALYVNVPTADKKGGEGPGGNFTRVGVGARYEDNWTGATANIGSYQIGELMVSLDSSNVRLMVKGANSAAEFIDVGIPPTNGSITPAMFADSAVTTAKINDRNVSNVKITADSITVHELDNDGLEYMRTELSENVPASMEGYEISFTGGHVLTSVTVNEIQSTQISSTLLSIVLAALFG